MTLISHLYLLELPAKLRQVTYSKMIGDVCIIAYPNNRTRRKYITYHPQINLSLDLSDDIIHIKIQERYGYSCEDQSDIANIIQMLIAKRCMLKYPRIYRNLMDYLEKDWATTNFKD